MSNMVVNTNILALNSHRALKNVGVNQSRASARLSSGLRVNSAADDAAGLAISEKMRSQIRGLDQASRNTQDGASLIQTAEGGITEISNMVQRIRELTVQASNDTNQAIDREKIGLEIGQLLQEIEEMASRVEFNNMTLLDGTMTGKNLQVGANARQMIGFGIKSMNVAGLGMDTVFNNALGVSFTVDFSIPAGTPGAFTVSDFAAAFGNLTSTEISELLRIDADPTTIPPTPMGGIDGTLSIISEQRATLGALQNRLEYTIRSLDISSENLSASESRIRDADMAKEMMKLTQSNVLQQAAISMLAQGNQSPQSILQLLS